ncbi:CAP domain-containing protein [Roseovarius sp. SCSIO 43702]|uniref:CAP domain-containing protein n=1 Tax=Roseovarius sp. SCSIO 43702 TaxID=2823043 RepID=UPI001C72B8E3|nr:CAP domain-containing protein [Roseovarius sp. SCSIO 43702]QYX56128.1 CAP domain-containing protein [Roseovarius sp. SCSIO 43702]
MKLTAPGLLALGLALAACGPQDGPVTTRPTTIGASDSAQAGDVTRDALARINDYRAQAGAPPLRLDATLARVASAHATEMFTSGRFSHTGADGSSVGDRVRRAGYGFCFVAENIAQGPSGVDEVLSGWMQSPGHRRNMLNPQADGVGLARRGDLWVMVLGRPGC